MAEKNKEITLDDLIGMIGNMASLDFSKRLEIEITDDPKNVIGYGLNMLSEELEANMVKRSILEEINKNLKGFTYTVAHDIRSPFHNAQGLISLIEMDIMDGRYENLNEYLSLLKQVYKQTVDMISGILEYSSNGYDNKNNGEINLTKFCDEITNVYSINHDVAISYDKDMPKINYNKQALKQIFYNLISNAIKHNDKEVCKIEIGCADKGAYHEIYVKDNGPGIEPKHLDNIFDLFASFKDDKNDSYGIGLSIVRKLVTHANGNINVESTAGAGAKFIFTINKTVV